MALPGFFVTDNEKTMTVQHMLRDANLLDALPTEALTIGTQTVACWVADDRASNDWVNGGIELQDRAVVIVKRTDLDVPTRGKLAGYREQTWRVAEVQRDHASSPIRIHLEKAT